MTIEADVARISAYFGIDPRLIQSVVQAEGDILKALLFLQLRVSRKRSGLEWRPSAANTQVGCESVDPVFLCSIGKDHLFPFDGDVNIASLVTALLATCGPAAIARLVVAVDVDAVKRVSVWARPHISKKRGKVGCPFLTHPYAAASVVLELFSLWLETTSLRMLPRHVFARFGRTMYEPSFIGTLSAEATAAFGAAAAQRTTRNYKGIAAIAPTEPVGLSFSGLLFFMRRAPRNEQPSEAFSGNVHQVHV